MNPGGKTTNYTPLLIVTTESLSLLGVRDEGSGNFRRGARLSSPGTVSFTKSCPKNSVRQLPRFKLARSSAQNPVWSAQAALVKISRHLVPDGHDLGWLATL